jgi:acrylyl-CoA reductase (NADPH)
MSRATFRGIYAARPDGSGGEVADIAMEDLPEREVTVRVAYSSLNYKDGLAVAGVGKVVRSHPMIAGIDLAGVVERSGDPRFAPGDEVLATGFGLGEQYWGGFAEYASCAGEWLVAVPPALGLRRAMALGTAGLTAMLCVEELERHGCLPRTPSELPVLVTGASGGVGSLAVALLSALSYDDIVASSGRPDQAEYLTALGAAAVVPREELAAGPARPLESERYRAAIDVVGGATLAGVLARIALRGVVAACGLVGGSELSGSVFPFILRGVTLAGVESVQVPIAVRKRCWTRLAELLSGELIDSLTTLEPLTAVPCLAREILAGKIRGRVVIEIDSSR